MDLYIKSILEGTHFSCNIPGTNPCNIDIITDHQECREGFLTLDANFPELSSGPGIYGLSNQFPSFSESSEAATECGLNNMLEPTAILNGTEDLHDGQQVDISLENSELSYSSDQYLWPSPTWQFGTLESVVSKSLELPNKIQRTDSCYSLNQRMEMLPPQNPLKTCIGGPIRNVSSFEYFYSNSSQNPKHCDLVSTGDSTKLWSGFNLAVGKDLRELQHSDLVEPHTSVSARERRKKISDKMRSLEKLIPGGTSKCDTARMLEEAIKYVKFLQAQVHVLEFLCENSAPSDFQLTCNAICSCRAVIENGAANTNNFQPKTRSFSCMPGTNSGMVRELSKEQMLSILVTSPIIQRNLYTAERCVCIGYEKMPIPSAGKKTMPSLYKKTMPSLYKKTMPSVYIDV